MSDDKSLRADAQRSRARLLCAAAEVFAERGTNAAFDDIAKRAGIGNATLYRHFPTRRDLVEALLADRYDELRTSARRLLKEPDLRAALSRWLADFVNHITAYRGMAATVMDTITDPETDLSASCKGMRDAAATLLSRAQDAAVIRPDLTVAELLRLANGVAVASEQQPKETRRRLLTLLTEGLAARAE